MKETQSQGKEMMKAEIINKKKEEVLSSLNLFLTLRPYAPPSWAAHLHHIPAHFCSLGHFPTPIHKWNLPNLPNNTEVWLKREDLCGMQLSGNKVRKLEFLIADALQKGADCIITIGCIQSNHCRAAAVAAKYFNLDTYIILFTSKALVNQDPGLMGNLLVERLVGAHVELVSKEEFENIGMMALLDNLKSKLLAEGRKPYVIPAGGSNSLGCCGGTVDGLSLGSWLSTLKAKVHAFSIYEEEDPDNYFNDFVQRTLDEFRVGINSHDIVEIYNARGLGYGINTSEELNFIREVAESTGVILDPIYNGKAAYGMMKDMGENPKKWEGKKILFIHTGGLLGIYGKVDEMGSIMLGKWRRMNIK